MIRKLSKSSLASAARDREDARAELGRALGKRSIADLASLPAATWQRLGVSGLLVLLGALVQRGRPPKNRFVDMREVGKPLKSWRDRHAKRLFALQDSMTMVPAPIRGLVAGIAAGLIILAVSTVFG